MTTGIQAAEQLTDIIFLQLDIVYFSYFVVSVLLFWFLMSVYFSKSVAVVVSTAWCSPPEGKKSDQYLVSCYYRIFINLASTDNIPKSNRFSIQLLCLHLSWKSNFHVHMTMEIIFFANSLINPMIYALRMPELRAGVSQLFRRKPKSADKPGRFATSKSLM